MISVASDHHFSIPFCLQHSTIFSFIFIQYTVLPHFSYSSFCHFSYCILVSLFCSLLSLASFSFIPSHPSHHLFAAVSFADVNKKKKEFLCFCVGAAVSGLLSDLPSWLFLASRLWTIYFSYFFQAPNFLLFQAINFYLNFKRSLSFDFIQEGFYLDHKIRTYNRLSEKWALQFR